MKRLQGGYAFLSVAISFSYVRFFFAFHFTVLGVIRMKHWCFILTFQYVVASSVISQGDPPAYLASADERNATYDDEDQMLLTGGQAAGSMTCNPKIKILCETRGENCTKHLGFHHCFVPSLRCSEPCQNGGLCYDGQCICPDCFTGDFCQFTIPCCNVSCLNGGICVTDRCICSVEFTGARCETKLTCGGLQCINGGNCTNNRCDCPSGYVVDGCEIDLHSCNEAVCTNGQCVHGKCECYAGWMGVRCEIRTKTIFIPCLPDPCLGDCHCVESCRHSNGYQCVSEGGYIGRNCSIPVPAVSCRSSSMVVTISKRFYDEFDQGAKNSYIYISPSLANPESFSKACRARPSFDDGNYVISINQPWSECGMELTSSSEGDLVIKNKIWINKDFSSDIYDSPLGVASIQCTYKSKYNISTSITPSIQLPRPTVTGVYQYSAEITLCKVSTCSQACPDLYKLTGTAVYTVGQLLHVGIDVLTPLLSHQLPSSNAAVLRSAFISCSPISVSSTTAVTIFQNSCPTLTGLLLQAAHGHPSFSRHHVCLSFRLPRNVQCAQIYIHAGLRVCHTGTNQTMCANGGSATRCTDSRREKRDSDDYLRPVVGPIYLIDRDGATEHVTYLGADQPVAMRRGRLPTPSVRNSESFLITAVGSGLLIIIASAVVTLVCLKRKGYSKQVVEPYE